MKLHVLMYVISVLGIAISMLNGTPVEGGTHLLIAAPWDSVIKASAVLGIAGWFAEAAHLWRRERA